MRSPIDRLLEGVFRIGRYRAWWVVAFWMLLTGAGAYYALDIPYRGAFLDLLPVNDPLIDEYRENEQYFGDAVGLLLELTGEEIPASDEEKDARLLAAAETLADVLSQEEEFIDVIYVQELSAAIPDQYVQLFSLDPDELTRIGESVDLARSAIGGGSFDLFGDEAATSDYASAGTLDDVYALISEQFNRALLSGDLSLDSSSLGGNPLGAQLDSIISLNDGVLQILGSLERLPSITSAVEDLSAIFMPETTESLRDPQAYISEDHTMLLMVVQPRFPSQKGVEYSTLVTDLVDADVEASGIEALGITVRQTGTYAFNKSTTEAINRDMLRTTIISSVGVFVIFILAFGSLFYSIVAVIPLLVSVVLTMAWAKFAVGGFNLVTTFLPALVLGLGIDYAIHIISRYAEERSKGKSLNRAMHTAILSKGKASLYAAMTTSLVFVGLLVAKSRALYEMGAISSVGVLLAFLATLLLLPALITLSHHLFRIRRKEGIVGLAPRMTGFFRLITGRARAVFVIILVLTFFVTFQAARTSFEFSSTDLVPRVESQEVADIVQANFSDSPSSVGSVFTFYASTGEQLRRIIDKLSDVDLQMDEYGLPDIVETISSPLDYIPVDLTEQQQMLNNLDIDAYVTQLDLFEGSLSNHTAVTSQIRTVLAQFSLLQYAASTNGDRAEHPRARDHAAAAGDPVDARRNGHRGRDGRSQRVATRADRTGRQSRPGQGVAAGRGSPSRGLDVRARSTPAAIADHGRTVRRSSESEPCDLRRGQHGKVRGVRCVVLGRFLRDAAGRPAARRIHETRLLPVDGNRPGADPADCLVQLTRMDARTVGVRAAGAGLHLDARRHAAVVDGLQFPQHHDFAVVDRHWRGQRDPHSSPHDRGTHAAAGGCDRTRRRDDGDLGHRHVVDDDACVRESSVGTNPGAAPVGFLRAAGHRLHASVQHCVPPCGTEDRTREAGIM